MRTHKQPTQIDELININNQLLCEIITTQIAARALQIQCETCGLQRHKRDPPHIIIRYTMRNDHRTTNGDPNQFKININFCVCSAFFTLHHTVYGDR